MLSPLSPSSWMTIAITASQLMETIVRLGLEGRRWAQAGGSLHRSKKEGAGLTCKPEVGVRGFSPRQCSTPLSAPGESGKWRRGTPPCTFRLCSRIICFKRTSSPKGSLNPTNLSQFIWLLTTVALPEFLLLKSLQSYPTLCNTMDYRPPGSSVHEILQARILEWVAISFVSREPSGLFTLGEELPLFNFINFSL